MKTNSDGLVRAILQQQNLKVSVAVITLAAREARARHTLGTAAASLMGQAMTGAALLASLQKGVKGRINLQLECDGPLRGLFVDASTDGGLRGYVKNPLVEVELADGEFRWRAALGNSGFLSVLRDVGEGEFYRSSVELRALDIAVDLSHYFAVSDQTATRLALDVRHDDGETLGAVAGVLVQALPDGDLEALNAIGTTLEEKLKTALRTLETLTPATVLAALGLEDAEVVQTTPVAWRCTCSLERALETVASLGLADVQDLLDTMGSTAVTCQFCATRHEISFHDLIALIDRLTKAEPKN